MNAIYNYLEKTKHSLCAADWYTHMSTFLSWYQNDVEKFHHYNVYNGIKQHKVDRYRLGMAKTVCEDYANLLLNERVTYSVGKNQQEWLSGVFLRNNFETRGNQLIELAFALGTGAFVEYKGADGLAVIDYIRGDMIYPLSWDNGTVTECAFGSLKQSGKDKLYYVQMHVRDASGKYIIENHMIDETGAEQKLPDGIEQFVPTGRDKPLFQIIKPNIINNIDLDCPMGISVYGNGIDELKGCDLIYDSYINEFRLGRKRLMVPLSMAEIHMQGDGTAEPIFADEDIEFYALPSSGNDGPKKIEEINMSIRSEDHERAINRALSLLSKKCGLGGSFYRFEDGVVKTATEVISTNSELYRSICKHEILLRAALTNLINALAFIEDKTIDAPVIGFDDSIIEDSQSIQNDNIAQVGAGLKSKLKAIMEIQHIDDEKAQAELDQIDKENGVTDLEFDAFGKGDA